MPGCNKSAKTSRLVGRRVLDRRQLLKNIALLSITQIGGAQGQEAAILGRHDVWDLNPADSIPENYNEISGFGGCRGCGGCGGGPSRRRQIVEFESYSLFLISNPDWLRPNSSDKLTSLYESYVAFSRAIGDRHSAIFFWSKIPKRVNGRFIDDDLAANIDTVKSASYAKAFNLNISESPHVVVTRKLPMLGSPVADFVVLTLNDLIRILQQGC